MSNDIGWGLLLNVFLWGMIMLVIAGLGILAAVSVFPESARKRGRSRGRKSGGTPPSPRPPQKDDDVAESYRKAS